MSEEIESQVEQLILDTLAMKTQERGFSEKEFGLNERKFKMAQKFLSELKKYQSINRGQKLRAIQMAINDPVLREEYIRASQPALLPELQSRPKKKA